MNVCGDQDIPTWNQDYFEDVFSRKAEEEERLHEKYKRNDNFFSSKEAGMAFKNLGSFKWASKMRQVFYP